MIAPKVFVRILALVMLIGHSRQDTFVKGIDLSEQAQQQLSPKESIYQHQQQQYPELSLYEQQQQLQQQVDNLSQDSLKRYLLKDLDLDGYTLKPPMEQWKLIRLNQLLDSLSTNIPTPTPAPIFRSGRNYPSASASFLDPSMSQNSRSQPALAGGSLRLAPNFAAFQLQQLQQNSKQLTGRSSDDQADDQQTGGLQQQQQQLDSVASSQSGGSGSGNSNSYNGGASNRGLRTRRPALLGIVWSPSRAPSPTGFVNVRRSHANSSAKGSPHHTIGTEEVALNTPMHSRSVSDYEWKRVENSRWNNLRGMWGKRGAEGGKPYRDDNDKQQVDTAAQAGTINSNSVGAAEEQ